MWATLTAKNTAYMGLVNFVFFGKRRLRFIAFSNGAYFSLRKATIPMLEAMWRSTLGLHILLIVGNRSKLQMFWIHARRIITSVHDNLAFWNWPDKLLIDVPMGLGAFSSGTASSCHNPVSIRSMISSPKPASRRFLNSVFYGYRSKNAFVFCKSASSKFVDIAQLAQVAAKSAVAAKQTFLLMLFHDCAPDYGPVVTIP